MSKRRSRLAIAFLALMGACVSTVTESYKDIEEAMEAEVKPLVDELLTLELNKDADKIDYNSIRRSAMSVRSIFRQTMDPKRVLYLKSGKYRASANTAANWFRDIATAAIAHLAHSTPDEWLFTSTDFNSYVTVSTAEGAPQRVEGHLAASGLPGLGVTPRTEILGPPVIHIT